MRQKPTFELARLAEAAKEGRVNLGKKRARDILLPLLGELLVCDEFACQVVRALKLTDFNVTKNLDGVLYDEYGIRLADDLLDQFGLNVAAWYVKVTLREGAWGTTPSASPCTPLRMKWTVSGDAYAPRLGTSHEDVHLPLLQQG